MSADLSILTADERESYDALLRKALELDDEADQLRRDSNQAECDARTILCAAERRLAEINADLLALTIQPGERVIGAAL